MNFCKCGCGTSTKTGQRFVRGHNRRGTQRIKRYAVDSSTGCWVWLLSKTSVGYGQVTIPGTRTNVLAHRFIYEQHRGKIPAGMHLDHLCRNRTCVNPDHLEIVTNAENVRRGHATKLTKEMVISIRSLLSSGVPGVEIATRFNVTSNTIYAIASGRSWTAI